MSGFFTSAEENTMRNLGEVAVVVGSRYIRRREHPPKITMPKGSEVPRAVGLPYIRRRERTFNTLKNNKLVAWHATCPYYYS